MDISANTLAEIENSEPAFDSYLSSYVIETMGEARLYPRLSRERVADVWGAWKKDLARVGEHEKKIENGLDHFKRAGLLAFWIRRFTPVTETVDLTKNIADAEGYPLSAKEVQFREFLFGYLNEYLAFDLGYLICSYYERAKKGGSARAESLRLNADYLRMVCHALKFKTVSPHALAVNYRSLFLE